MGLKRLYKFYMFSIIPVICFTYAFSDGEEQKKMDVGHNKTFVASEKKITIHRKLERVNGIDLFYLDTKTKGPAIVCLHGRWGRAETWSDFMNHYGYKYRIIAPDQRGHGLSSKPVSKYTPDEMGQDIILLLDKLNIKKAIIVGHSMGGHVAGYIAANYQDRVSAIALLDKSPSGPSQMSQLPLEKLKLVDPLTKDWPMPFPTLKTAEEFIREEMQNQISYEYFINSLIENEDGYKMMFSTQAIAALIEYYTEWYNWLENILCPVLIIRSSKKEAVTDQDLDKMKRMLKQCIFFEMSKPDHSVHLSDTDEFYSYFDHFLIQLNPDM